MQIDRRVVNDAALAGLLAILGVTEVLAPFSTVMGEGSSSVAVALVCLMCAALALRRLFPLPVLVAVSFPLGVTGLFTDVLVPFWGGLVPMAVAAYSVARHGRGTAPYVGAGALVAAIALDALTNEAFDSPAELWFPCVVLLLAWVIGKVIADTRQTAAVSVRRAEQVVENSREEALRAITEERTRIARELHDVVANAVTAMVVQANAAGQVVRDEPELVERALDGIRETGSQALDEMRRVVTLLRDDTPNGDLAPQPGLGDLPTLIAASQTTATQVHLTVQGTPRRLTPSTDLAGYRIVQEALTNVHRHARARNASVTISYLPDELCIQISDDGAGAPPGAHGQGHGLIGMRERVAARGGSIEFSSGDGFAVTASLPAAEDR